MGYNEDTTEQKGDDFFDEQGNVGELEQPVLRSRSGNGAISNVAASSRGREVGVFSIQSPRGSRQRVSGILSTDPIYPGTASTSKKSTGGEKTSRGGRDGTGRVAGRSLSVKYSSDTTDVSSRGLLFPFSRRRFLRLHRNRSNSKLICRLLRRFLCLPYVRPAFSKPARRRRRRERNGFQNTFTLSLALPSAASRFSFFFWILKPFLQRRRKGFSVFLCERFFSREKKCGKKPTLILSFPSTSHKTKIHRTKQKTTKPKKQLPFFPRKLFFLVLRNQQTPCHFIASATLRKPAMLAPATRSPSIPYSLAAS